MILFNLYLILKNETIKVYDNFIESVVYEGSSEDIPYELMSDLVHDMTIAHEKDTNRTYFLIHIN